MASIVIVADQCYLLAEAVNYVVINEVDNTDDHEWYPRTKKQKALLMRKHGQIIKQYNDERKPYNVIINFIAKNNPNVGTNQNTLRKAGNEDNTSISIRVHGYQNALKLFSSIVDQLREQIPDEVYLNKLVEKFLTSITEER